MGEDIQILPDGKNLLGYSTNQHPDFAGTDIFINEGLNADIPTYQFVADGVAATTGKNVLAVFNRTPKRVRIQYVYCYPRTLGNNTVTVQLGYINALPTGGAAINAIKHAFDNPDNPAAPNNVVALKDNSPTSAIVASPIAGVIFGGTTFSNNAAGKYDIFNPVRNMSALQLRPNSQDGIILVVSNASSALGTFTSHVGITLD